MTILLIVAAAFFTALMFYKALAPWLERHQVEALELDDELRQLEELVSLKTLLMQSLRELDFDLELEKITSEDHAALKRRYEQQIIQIMRKLDALHGGRGWEQKIEDELARRAQAAKRLAPQPGQEAVVEVAQAKAPKKTKKVRKNKKTAAASSDSEDDAQVASQEVAAHEEAAHEDGSQATPSHSPQALASADARSRASGGAQVDAEPAAQAPERRPCHACGASMELHARFCSQCGVTLTPLEAAVQSLPEHVEEVR